MQRKDFFFKKTIALLKKYCLFREAEFTKIKFNLFAESPQLFDHKPLLSLRRKRALDPNPVG